MIARSRQQEHAVEKEPVLDRVNVEAGSALKKYQDFFVGSRRMRDLLRYELAVVFLASMPGALGLVLRKAFYPRLFKRVGQGVVFGRQINIRHPGKIELGDRTAIDDFCMIDAKDTGETGIQIGNDVAIARETTLQGKGGGIIIGDGTAIGSQCRLSAPGGITLGQSVMIAGQCYIGGGRYRTDDLETPIKDQPFYTLGPVVIEDDVWLGAGVIVQDGVRIGRGTVVGAGSVVQEDLPEYTIVVPRHRLVMIPRGKPQ